MTNENRLEAMKAVYTYFFPEVRPLVNMELNPKLFLTITPQNEAQRIVDSMGFRKKLIVPETLEGKVDLDRIHEPVIERITEIYEPFVKGLKDFQYRYFTSGSSEGIFHVLSELKAKGVDKIFNFFGEYEGYKEYGKTLGIDTAEVPIESKVSGLEKGVWFISNPSAIDGNIIPNERINEICDLGNSVNLDLAYVGATRKHEFDITNPNIKKVFLSFSKPYGVFRWRIGFTFSREPIDSLYGNKWFKDISRVFTGLRLAEEIGPSGLYEKYKGIQEKIIDDLNQRYSLNMKTSDVLLLGNISEKDSRIFSPEKIQMISQYRRGDGYRLCLTPYYELNETGGLK